MDAARLEEIKANPHAATLEELAEAHDALSGEPNKPKAEPELNAQEGTTAGAQDKQDQQTESARQTEADGIVLKDGKTVLPYSVLEAERQSGKAARDLAASLQRERDAAIARNQELEEQVRQKSEKASVTVGLSAESLAAMEEEAPEFATAFKGIAEQASQTSEALAKSNETVRILQERIDRQEKEQVEAQVNAAIAQVPKLAYAKSLLNDGQPEVFNAIAEIDTFLRTQPSSKNLPMAQRFEKAVSMYEAANGAFSVPGAKAVEQQSKRGALVPSTLSDLSGGSIPPKSALENLAGLNGEALIEKMFSMSQEQRDQLAMQLPM